MKPHKWAKEIKAWADGAEIDEYAGGNVWLGTSNPQWNENIMYRIRPAPKQPQYLYAYVGLNGVGFCTEWSEDAAFPLLGKIKLEQDDE